MKLGVSLVIQCWACIAKNELCIEIGDAIEAMLHEQRQSILEQDKTVTGFNVGINAGASAGQTVFHVHVHLIPRRDGDVVNPKGGVRGVITSKQGY